MSADSLPERPRGAPAALHHVRKRDGREMPFDLRKIAAAVASAMAAVGEEDPAFPDEVAGVVELALERRHPRSAGGEPPGIEEIQDLVEQALIEMGRAAVAKAYILYRDRRARVRDALRVHKGPSPAARLRVQEADRTAPWSKGRIVAALLAEADLPRDVAEDVATRVEQRVFASGLTRITTGLVRELVDNVLVSMGLTAALRRQESVGLPRHDLRRILAGVSLEEWEFDARTSDPGPFQARPGPRVPPAQAVAGEVLRRYALEDVLDPGVAELHLAGDLHVEDLRQPHLPLTLSVPAELLLAGEPTPGAAFDLLAELAAVAGCTARGVVLEDPALVLQPLVRGTRAGSPLGLAAWLRGLAATARAANRRIDLGTPGPRFSTFAARLVTELSSLSADPFAPRLFLDGAELAALLSGPSSAEAPGAESHAAEGLEPALERLLAGGRIVPTWAADGAPQTTGPGCARHPRERTALASAGAVVLNLPRLARRAGPWREDVFLEQLVELVRCALGAARSLERFRARYGPGDAGAAAGTGAAGLRTRSAFALVPSGLREALQRLTGGEVDPELGSRVLGLAAEAAGRFAAEGDPTLLLVPFHGAEGCARFARLDALEDRGQGVLFGDFADAADARARTHGSDAPGPGRAAAARPYSEGFRISPVPGFWPGEAEARLCCTVPTGALWPPPAAPQGSGFGGGLGAHEPGREPLSHLGAWLRFAAGRSAVSGDSPDTLWSPASAALRDVRNDPSPSPASSTSPPVSPPPVDHECT